MSRTSDPHDTRIFRMESRSRLDELNYTGFATEDPLHRLIEDNIGTLFHGLTFLKREFRELDGGKHVPDTVAFDMERNTFVVIEYKNKRDPGVIAQTKTYLKYMKNRRHALVLEYAKSEGKDKANLDLGSYKWDVYAIIMAPKFDKNSVDSTEDDGDLELYEIRRYGESTVMVRRIGGAHERTPVISGPISGLSNVIAPSYETVRTRLLAEFPGAEVNEKPKHYNGFRYPGRAYFCSTEGKRQIVLRYSDKSVTIKSMDDFEQALADMKATGPTETNGMDHLYAYARAKLLSTFPNMVENKKQFYDRFSIGDQLVCTMGKQKSKIWLYYSGSVANPALNRPKFVLPGGVSGWGLGRWRSAIRSTQDFDRALGILSKLHATNRLESGPEKKAELEPEKNEDRKTKAGPLRVVPLLEIDFKKEKQPPLQVSWNGATRGRLKSWVDVLVCVAEWLVINHGKLTQSSCPVMSGSKWAILNSSPFNPNGTKFLRSKRIGELFLNTHGDKKTVIRNACKLADAASVDVRFFEATFSKEDD